MFINVFPNRFVLVLEENTIQYDGLVKSGSLSKLKCRSGEKISHLHVNGAHLSGHIKDPFPLFLYKLIIHTLRHFSFTVRLKK